MTWSRLASINLFLVAGSIAAIAQIPVADFSAPASVCLNEAFVLTDESQSAESYEWDFCEVDLVSTPVFSSMGVIAGSIAALDIKVILDGENWRGFVCDGGSGNIHRLDFGTSLTNTPTVTAVATALPAPSGIEMVNVGDNWYGLIGTFNLPSHLYVLDFGDSPGNTPTLFEVNLGVNNLLQSRSLTMVQEGNDLVVLIANWGQSKITRVNFGPVISATPQSVDLIDVFGSNNLIGITASEDATGKYALVTVFADHQLLKFSFGSSWLNTPAKTVVNAGSISNPTMIQIEFEGNSYYAMLMLSSGRLLRLNFGGDLSGNTPLVDDLGTFSNMTNVYGMHVVRNASAYAMMVTSLDTNELYRIDFDGGDCGASMQTSSLPTPPFLSYSTAGNHVITLRVKGTGILADAVSHTVGVSATAAPELAITIENNQCLGQPNEFSTSSNETVTSEAWNFGDLQSSSSLSPTHTFATPGVYNVTAKATVASGCHNIAQSTITVFNQPDFDLPTANPICTKQEYSFINTTDFDVAAVPVWEWKVNGVTQTGNADLHYVILTADPHEVELIGSNAECTSSAIKDLINLLDGPETDFTVTDACAGAAVLFTNTTTGDASSYQWDFDDGTHSTEQSPTKSFANAGKYDVLLTASNSAGCENFKTKILTISSNPLPAFSLDLPPFSCAGSGSQFHDQTPNPDDSNLQSWLWNFDDGSTGTGKNPVHTYSQARQYNVSMTVTTDKGCGKSVSKLVTISPSPGVDFTNGPACVNQPTLFIGSSPSAIKSWQWKIGSAIYQQLNATHTFTSPGTNPIQLTATATNNCVSTITRSVVVPIVPALDIAVVNACAGQETKLKADVGTSDDTSVAFAWTFGGGVTAAGQEVTRTYSQTGNYAVALQVTMASGCKYSRGEIVAIHAVPSVAFTPAETYGAAPLEVQFTNATTGGATYLWHFAGSADLTSTDASPTFTYDQLGTYAVTLEATSADGCTASSNGNVHVIVPYTDLSLEEFSLLADPVSGTTKGVLRIRNNSNYPATPVNFVIDLGAGVLLNETVTNAIGPESEVTLTTASSLTFQSAGNGFVCVTASISNDQVPDNNRQCVALRESSELFEPYPNPTQGILSLQVISPATESVSIRIVSSNGADAYSKEVDAKAGLNVFELDLSMLTAGLYVIQVYTATSQILTRRISIQY